MQQNKLRLEPPRQFPLPELRDRNSSAGRLVSRAVHITLAVLATLLATAVAVAFVVRIDATVEAAGTLEPVRVWPVRTLEAGVVREVLVKTGDRVRRGETIARLDPLLLRSALDEARASYRTRGLGLRKAALEAPLQSHEQEQKVAQAGARVTTARATLLQRMVERDLGQNLDSLLAGYRPGSNVLLDLAVADVQFAEAERRAAADQVGRVRLGSFDREMGGVELEQLGAQIRTLEERLGRLDVPAPTSGVVLTEHIEQLPGVSVGVGDLLLEMADPGQWRAVVFVREDDVHKIEVGDSVKLEVQAFRTEERDLVYGTVSHIAADPVQAPSGAAGAASSSTGPYRVVATLDRAQLAAMGVEKFRRGYTVDARIVTRSGRIVDLLWDYLVERYKTSWRP